MSISVLTGHFFERLKLNRELNAIDPDHSACYGRWSVLIQQF